MSSKLTGMKNMQTFVKIVDIYEIMLNEKIIKVNQALPEVILVT